MIFRQQDFVPPPESGGGSRQTSTAVDDDQDQEVDTTLRLAFPCYFSRNPTPPPAPTLRWFLPGFFDGVENDVVDTTLRLCPPGTVIPPKKPKNSDIPPPPPPVVFDPTPLRWFRGGVDSPAKNSRNYSNKKEKRKLDGGDDQKKKKKRIRWHDAEASTSAAGDDEKKKRRRGDEEDQRRPLIPIGGLVRAVESRGGSRPEFLYKKKLVESDVSKELHRVFLSGGETVMMEFLREEEAAAVIGKGLTMVGVDGGGNVYEKLVLKKWASLKMVVINSDWNDVVAANKVKKDDVMEIWGYRENGKSCLAFNFWRGEGDNHAHAASSSNNGVIKIKS